MKLLDTIRVNEVESSFKLKGVVFVKIRKEGIFRNTFRYYRCPTNYDAIRISENQYLCEEEAYGYAVQEKEAVAQEEAFKKEKEDDKK